jgi:hypothetical protein
MSYPTPTQLDAWAQTLSATNWTRLTTRLNHAIERDRRGGSNIPDGYPATTLGGSGGTAELTPTEAAAYARSQPRPDEHHDRTRNAVSYLEQAVMSLAALVTQLDRIEARVVIGATTSDDWCVVHARHGMTEIVYRAHYCRWCYDFRLIERVDPPPELIAARAEGRRITETMVRQALAGRTA